MCPNNNQLTTYNYVYCLFYFLFPSIGNMILYRTQDVVTGVMDVDDRLWMRVSLAGVAVTVGVACSVIAANVGPTRTSLYTNVAQTTTPKALGVIPIGGQRPAVSATTKYFVNMPSTKGPYIASTSPADFLPNHRFNPSIWSTPSAVGVMLLSIGCVVYKFFQKLHTQAPSTTTEFGAIAAATTAAPRKIHINSQMVDEHTSYAMMTISGGKQPIDVSQFGIQSPVFPEYCDQTGITLTRWMLEVARANPDYPLTELESVFMSIQTACKTISKLVKRASIDGSTGYQGGGGSINVQGEEQKKLDVITNDVIKKALKFTGRMGVLASEEEDNPLAVENGSQYNKEIVVEEDGTYICVFDPLDGSSNVDAGIPVGTIFGIFEEDGTCELPEEFFEEGHAADLADAMKDCLRSTLKPGSSLVASGYALYSSATHFVFTLGNGVNGFTLDEEIGEFILTHPNMQIPPRGNIYSMNEANAPNWDGPVKKFVSSLADGSNRGGNVYTSRYIGSMVGDVHRTLLYGGVFGYPADKKNVDGKLRLLYEAAPMSFLMEQAGGKSTTGMVRCMNLPPKSVHQRVPLMMGGADEIAELQELYHDIGTEEEKASQTARARFN